MIILLGVDSVLHVSILRRATFARTHKESSRPHEEWPQVCSEIQQLLIIRAAARIVR